MGSMLLWVSLPTWLAIAWRKTLATIRPEAKRAPGPRNIIVFRLDQLGDLVLTTPLFHELKRHFSGAECTVVVRSEYKSILAANPNVDGILSPREIGPRWLPGRARWLATALWFYWTQLRHRRFELAISPRWDVDDSLATMLCVLTSAQRRVGYCTRVSSDKREVNPGFDLAFDVLVPPGQLRHEVDRNLAVADALGVKIKDRQLEIRLTDNDRRFADELLKHHDKARALVALGIGGRAAGRKWPLERYAECIARINQTRLVQPLIVCSTEEDAEASVLSLQLTIPPYILSGTPLRAVCAVLECCDLFLGNDTGTAHLAAAMNCPTVVVSRHPANGDPSHANSPARFAPRCSGHRVVQPLCGAGNCVASCRESAPHCILQVTARQVANAALELLSRQQQGSVGGSGIPLVAPSRAAGGAMVLV